MRALELPAGAGGMALGLHRAGIEAVALVEWDPSACATLRAAVAEGRLCGEVVEADCSELDYSRWRGVDLVCGGPPCQPFSGSGKGLGEHDDRDGFPWFLRAVEEVAPRYVLIENVRGLLFEKHAAYLAGILQQLEALGFVVKIGLLNCADFGVPQTRERVFIWGARHGEAMPDWPKPTHADPRKGLSLFGLPAWVSAEEAVGEGGMVQIDGQTAPVAGGGRAVRERSDEPSFAVRTIQGGGSHIYYRLVQVNGQTSAGPGGERVSCERTGDLPAFAVRAGSRGDNAKFRLQRPAPSAENGRWLDDVNVTSLDAPSKTVVANHNQATVRLDGEVFRVPWQWRAAWQSFPPDWPWQGAKTHIDRQIGNALPPLMAEHLGRVLMDAGETTEGASPEGARG